MQCIMPQNLTTPDRLLNNPLSKKGFCEAQQYRCALERCNDGYASMNLQVEIHNDFIEVLKTCSEAVAKWAEQSKKKINNCKESSTTKQAWRDSVLATKKYVERNNAVAEAIEKNVVKELTAFKNKYGKCLIGVQKSKDLEKQFKRYQTPWLDTVNEITEKKSAYHDARRKLEDVKDRHQVTKTDVSCTEEEIRKASQEVDRRLRKLDSCKRKYHSSIDGLSHKQKEYEKDMLRVLSDADDFEKDRLKQVQSSFEALKGALLIETEKYQSAIATEFEKAMALQKIDEDLAYFDKTFGSQTKSNWPNFEEIKD